MDRIDLIHALKDLVLQLLDHFSGGHLLEGVAIHLGRHKIRVTTRNQGAPHHRILFLVDLLSGGLVVDTLIVLGQLVQFILFYLLLVQMELGR